MHIRKSLWLAGTIALVALFTLALAVAQAAAPKGDEETPTPVRTATPTRTATATRATIPTVTATPTRESATATATVATITATSVPPSSTPTSVPPTGTRAPMPATSTPTPAAATSTPTTSPPTRTPTPLPQSGGRLVLDGRFGDWVGREHISDPPDDGKKGADIHYLYWGTNPNDSSLYFMIERYPDELTEKGQRVSYIIHIDTDNNGKFNDDDDRDIHIDYTPKDDHSDVEVQIGKSKGKKLAEYNGDWGESTEDGALRVEVRAPFVDLDIISQQTIRFYLQADTGAPPDRAPDRGDIQWSPIPILGYPLLAAVMAGVILLVWWKKGRFAWRAS